MRLLAGLAVAAACLCVVFVAGLFVLQGGLQSALSGLTPAAFQFGDAPTPNAPTQTAIANLSATAGAQAQWPVRHAEEFDSNDRNWTTGDSFSDRGQMRQEVVEGKYRWELTLNDNQGIIGSGWPDYESEPDFYLTAEVRKVVGPESTDYGVIFRRVDDGNFYFFGVNDSGLFNFALMLDGEWVDFRTWAVPSAVEPGKPNRVAVSALGDHFVFFVNETFVGQVTDDRLATGKVGFMAQVREPGAQNVFQFDNLELRAPLVSAAGAPTATAAGELYATASEWRVVFSDTFESISDGWPSGNTQDAYAAIGWETLSDRYVWTATAHQNMHWHEVPNAAVSGDFMLTVDAQIVQGPRDANYGVVFRWLTEDDFFYFGITDEHTAHVWLRQSDEWATVAVWTGVSAVKSGEVNRIAAIGEQAHFTFLVNGSYVGEVESSSLSRGRAGLAIGLANAGDHAVFSFDNFVVRVPPATPTPPREPTRRPSLTRTAAHTPAATATADASPAS